MRSSVGAGGNEIANHARGQALKRAADCFVSPEEVKRNHLKASATLVDVRLAADFGQYHIPGSLNIPLHLVKTKSFLKSQPLVLLNEGRSTSELERSCGELRAAGFRGASVLAGGLNGWRAAGGELVGDGIAVRSLDRVTAEEMLRERDYANWLVLDFTNGAHKDLYPWLPVRVERIGSAPAKKRGDMVRAALARAKQVPLLQVVVVAETDADYAIVEPLVRNAGIKQPLYLAGGMRGYGESLNRQVALWRGKEPKALACRG